MTAPYDTKTVRVHEPDQGRYVYLMCTRFDGGGHLLGEIGYGSEFTQFAVMSLGKSQRVADTDPFALAQKFPGEWFRDSNTMDLMYALDQGPVSWIDLRDGMHLGADDVAALVEVEA